MRWTLLLALAALGCEEKSLCPDGTKQFGEPPRKGFEVICKRQSSGTRWINHGPKTTWHMTGQKKLETTFADGREEGTRTEWAENGKKTAERRYVRGKLDGLSIEWSAEGQKTKETEYKDDVRHGKETIYYPTGSKKSVGHYKHGVLMGGLRTWMPDGTAVAEVEWVPYELSFFKMGPKATWKEGEKEVVKPFEMSLSEVTVEQYRVCVTAKKCTPPKTGAGCNWDVAGRAKHPVNCVSWAQAKVFASWAKGRLPTAGEWEFVARSGGRETPYPWGPDAVTCDHVVMGGCGAKGTAPVCSKTTGNTINSECDLLGNVAEWLAIDPDAEGKHHVRGGHFATAAKDVNATGFQAVSPKTRSPEIGFRVARSVGPQ